MSLFDSIAMLFAPARELSPQVRSAIDSAAQLVDPMLRAAPGYPQCLAGPASRALQYCAGLAQAIPGPVEIGRRAFAADPFVHALLGCADDIREMLGRSHAVREYLDSGGVDASFHALLGMRRREKHQFGMVLEGDVIRTEVPQTLLYFGDHTLSDPAADEGAARERLRASMFRGLVESFALHVQGLRRESDQTRLDRVVERARAARRQNASVEVSHATHSRRLHDLDAALSACAEDISPVRLIGQLAACFEDPSPFLSLNDLEVVLDRMGIVADGNPAEGSADRLRFVEMTGRDRRHWVVVLAQIDRDEAVQAVQAVEQATRYIVI